MAKKSKKNNNSVTTTSDNNTKTSIIAQKQQMFIGPLPPPDILAHYNEIHPDAADRIIKLAENESKHRHAMDKYRLFFNALVAHSGQWFGFLLGVLGLGGGIYCISKGQNWGTFISGISLVSLVSIFVIGKKKKS